MRLFLTACSIAALSLFTSCNDNNKTYKLIGEAKGFEDNTQVIIYEIIKDQPQPIDTLEIINEAFSGTFKFANAGDIYLLNTDLSSAASLIYSPENTDLTAVLNKEDPSKSYVSGNQSTEAYYQYLKDVQDINEDMMELNMRAGIASQSFDQDSPEMQELIEEMQGLVAKQAEIQKAFVKNNSNSIFSVLHVQNLIQSQNIDFSEAESLISHLTPAISNHDQTKKIKDFIERSKSKLNVGDKAPDFSAPTPEGEDLALSTVMTKGKYTLIDFWAAWCPPCRIENPNLVKLYEKYHDKGLEVLGVSFDRDREEWLGAISKDKLPWHQISNVEFWEDPIAKLYKLEAIPSSFIIDSEGNIIAKDLRGKDIHDFMEELLGE